MLVSGVTSGAGGMGALLLLVSKCRYIVIVLRGREGVKDYSEIRCKRGLPRQQHGWYCIYDDNDIGIALGGVRIT